MIWIDDAQALPFALDYADADSTGAGSPNASISGLSFGDAPVGAEVRQIVAICMAVHNASAGTGVISSPTIGGVAATIDVQTVNGSSDLVTIAIVRAVVPSGTSGTVAFTVNGGYTTAAAITFRMMNPANGGTPDATNSDNTPSSGVLNLNVTAVAGGAAVAASYARNASTTTMTGVTEDVDVDTSTGEYQAAGHATGLSAGSLTITFTNADTTPDNLAGVSATYH